MPLYEYRCKACRKQVEVIQSFSAKPLTRCESCGGKLEKLISRSGFVLKGSGWYETDYKAKPAPSKSDSSSGDAPSSEPAGGDSGGGEGASPKKKKGGKPSKSLAPVGGGDK